jgi:hypothetical protein
VANLTILNMKEDTTIVTNSHTLLMGIKNGTNTSKNGLAISLLPRTQQTYRIFPNEMETYIYSKIIGKCL